MFQTIVDLRNIERLHTEMGEARNPPAPIVAVALGRRRRARRDIAHGSSDEA